MATLALGIAGQALGAAVLPAGLSVLGTTLSGAAVGGAVGTVAGAFIDQALFGASGQTAPQEGPRLSDLKVSASTEGAVLPRIYGAARLPGQLVWATDFEEEAVVVEDGSEAGGKATGSGATTTSTGAVVEYRYYANVAYALCEGPITRVGRIWADGKELAQADYTIRVHTGTETQTPDSLIEAREGSGLAPAYRGTAYVVFERLPLERFGNRLPQLNFEVFRAVDDFDQLVRAIDLIPSAGEFVYEPDPVTKELDGTTSAENVHTSQGGSDWAVAIDQLQAQLPNVDAVSLVVAWMGTDLRIGQCQIRPGVEVASKSTSPYAWSAGGVERAGAHVVSTHDGGPAYGGTPSDASVVQAIQDLKARGFQVVLYPFILMDVPAGNTLPDPYSGATGQPPYPWRGRITCDPAPGQPGSPDQSAAAATQVQAFIGSAQVSDFAIAGTAVTYSGPAEWSYRRFILHLAHLAKAAGGVDGFLIGSEMPGASTIRGPLPGTYPFVQALVTLAGEVKTLLGAGTAVTYAANWTEYFGHQPQDGSGDVYFHLDPLWASSAIDAVAIDAYFPLADWRDGGAHLDALAGVPSIYDLAYLKGNLVAGEAFDWYYPAAGATGNEASPERLAQTRLPISDGAYGKPWVFRPKDIKGWWSNYHYDRPGGVEAPTPTAWVPQSKPVWLTEIGCPAVDKGANQPNVFIDPKSSESFAPFFSRGTRDDLMQRRYLRAFYEFFDPAHPDYIDGSNPTSSVYGGPMIPLDRIFVYCWDARPYPAFPLASDVWGDTGNWELGHWLTGRIAGGALDEVVAALLEDFGFARYDVSALTGFLEGYALDAIMSARAALQPLELAFFFDSIESGAAIRFAHRGRAGSLATFEPQDLVDADGSGAAELFELTRGQESELPVSAKVTYVDTALDYRQAVAEARRLAVRSERVATASLPIALNQSQALAIAESLVQDAWAARERARFVLPPSALALEPGDMITLRLGGRDYPLRLTETREGVAKEVTALSIEPEVFAPAPAPRRTRPPPPVVVFGQPTAIFLDLPLMRGDENPVAGWLAADADPWPGAIAFYRSPAATGFTLNAAAPARAVHGTTLFDVWSGPLWRRDRVNVLRVTLAQGALGSVSEPAWLNGANLAAIENADGEWELLQFETATLVAADTYDLAGLLRGQFGTEGAMRDPVAAGARFVLITPALVQAAMTAADVGLVYNWKVGPASRPLDDPAYLDASHAFSGLGLRPYAPVHLRGRRDPATGDWTLSWIRRTRLGGDSWEGLEVPLAEEAERYRLEILAAPGGAVLRTVELTEPSYLYTAAAQTSDFGAPQWNIPMRVAQVSPVYGPGPAAEYLAWHH